MKNWSLLLGATLLTSCSLRPAGLVPPQATSPLLAPQAGQSDTAFPDVQSQGLSETNDLIVRFKDGHEEPTIDATYVRSLLLPRTKVFKARSLEHQAELLTQLREHPAIEYVEPDYPVQLQAYAGTPDDYDATDLWGLAKSDVPGAWALNGVGGNVWDANVRVAVIDTGVRTDHPDLASNCVAGFDFHNIDSDPMDDNGHGTHVAGTIAAIGNNNRGVVGAAPNCTILPIKAMGSNGSGATSATTNAIIYAVQNGADVINMSLGSRTYSLTERNAIDYAIGQGVVVVAAAGNSNTSIRHYPAAYPGVISVGATTNTDARASFSNFGNWVSIAAPGVNILSTDFEGGYSVKQGTSMASPLVAGVAALLRAQHPDWSVQQIKAALESSGDDTATGFTGSTLKRLNAPNALQAAEPDDTTPSIRYVGVTPSYYTATFRYESSEAVNTQVELSTNADLSGATTIYGPSSKASLPIVTAQSLTPGTTYYYRATVTDPSGQQTPDTIIRSFRTLPVTLTGLRAYPSLYTTTLTFATSVPTTDTLSIGTDPNALAAVGSSSAASRTHSLALSSLKPQTRYYYRIQSTDAFGNSVSSTAGLYFTTGSPAFTRITYSRTNNSITLNWTTSIATTNWAGANASSAGTFTVQNDTGTPANTHTFTITGLNSATRYYVKIGGKDADGNPVVAGPFLLTTL